MLRVPKLSAVLALTLAATSATVAQTASTVDRPPGGSASNSRSATSETLKRDVADAVVLIQQNYAGAGTLDLNHLFTSSLNALLHTLDPHSNYLDPQASVEFSSFLKGEYFGIGTSLAQHHDDQGVLQTYIQAPFENSPAYRAGLSYGDRLVEIDGVAIPGLSFDEVREHLIGLSGTKVSLMVAHPQTGTREPYQIVRAAIPQHSVPIAYLLRPGVGYVLITNFSKTTGAEFRAAMANLHSQGMESLVLDLRDNAGGIAVQAVQVATTFLPEGRTVFSMAARKGRRNKFTSDNASPDQTPIVVLIDHQTASSGEILSGALQDNDRAFFLGEKTYGKGLIQIRYGIQKTSILLLTTARYVTPSGRWIQRDYSDGSLYNYFNGGPSQGNDPVAAKGVEYKTITGRIVYGGGGVAPDVVWTTPPLTTSQLKFREDIRDPIAAFSRDLALGSVPGFEANRIVRPIAFDGALKPTDFPIDDPLFQAFRHYAAERWKFAPARIDREREYVERLIRVELATAAYGSDQSLKIVNQYDPEITKALKLIPRAKQLAQSSFQLAPKK